MKIKSNQAVLLVLAALAVAIAILTWANAPHGSADGRIAIVLDGVTLRTWSMQEIAALPAVDVQKAISSASHADESGNFRCVDLRVLLDMTDKDLLDNDARVIARASDGYTAAFSADEIRTGGNILVAYAKDGTDLGTMDDGGTGPFRMIIRDDAFGTRGTKYLIEIEIEAD